VTGRAKRNAGRGSGAIVETGKLAHPDHTAYQVIVVKGSSGRRVIAGTCKTLAAAQSWASLIQTYGRIVGDRAYVVERDGDSEAPR